MDVFLAAVVGFALHLGSAAPAQLQAGCPAPDERDESRVTIFLSQPQLAELRNIVDFGSAAASDVHALAGEADRTACVALWRATASSGRRSNAGDRVAFFRSGDRYFVTITPRPPTDRIRLGEHSMIEIYDLQYRFIDRFSA